jgi:hypothetical protein
VQLKNERRALAGQAPVRWVHAGDCRAGAEALKDECVKVLQ